MIANVRDAALDPRLIAPDQRHHAGAIDFRQGVPFSTMENDAHLRPGWSLGIQPVVDGVDHSQRLGRDRHVLGRIVDAASM